LRYVVLCVLRACVCGVCVCVCVWCVCVCVRVVINLKSCPHSLTQWASSMASRTRSFFSSSSCSCRFMFTIFSGDM
jgi:hypothetical protein